MESKSSTPKKECFSGKFLVEKAGTKFSRRGASDNAQMKELFNHDKEDDIQVLFIVLEGVKTGISEI